jgi:hypothetical protein
MKVALLYITFVVGLFLVALVIATSLSSNLVGAQTPCYTPNKLASTNGATWPPGANVTVVINPNDFIGQEQAIKDAFINW